MDGIQKWLDGKKTFLAGVAAALTAIGTAIASLQDGFQFIDLQLWGAAASAVLLIFGLGGKLEKIKKELSNLK